MRSFGKAIIGLGLLTLAVILHAQLSVQSFEVAEPAAASDSIVQLIASESGLIQVAPADLPRSGTYWLILPSGTVPAPMPCPPLDASLPIFQIATRQFIVDASSGQVAVNPHLYGSLSTSDARAAALTAQAESVVNLINRVQEAQFEREFALAFGLDDEMVSESPENFSPMMLVADPNGLYLEITNVSQGWSHLNLCNATNLVYAIWSTTNLLTPFAVETELWPTTNETSVLPFTLPTLNRQNWFVRAEDWTDKDSNGDGIPDWWIWKYFGDLAESATDVDLNGNTLGDDYTNNVTPVTFHFMGVEASNKYVNLLNLPVQLNITGNPYYVAVSVDDTNYATSATWSRYSSSNLTVHLGTVEGWHDVWIGLRGHGDETSDAVWQWHRLKLDLTPPALTITNPMVAGGAAIVGVPVIQLSGYTPEPLRTISYDVTNATGCLTNQQILVVNQYFDLHTSDFTTNTFQGFDIPLTNGLNRFTLHATDLAGNTTTTNFSFTLSYAGKTNPPLVLLNWPQNGMKVCGSNLLWTGSVSDPTATVVAQAVDAGGNTNLINGMVGREGIFWIQNVPLGDGTNVLTLTVTDAAGNHATTNIAVLQGDVGLIINPVSASATTVTGTINSTDYTVWVNGVKATVNGSGAWTARKVPIAPQPLVQVTAIPNADNGGNGSGGGPQANPNSANSQNGTALTSEASGIYYDFYQSYFEMNIPSASVTAYWRELWQHESGGFETDEAWNWEDGYPYIYKRYDWQGSSWPQGYPYPTNAVFYFGWWETNSLSTYYLPLNEEYADNTESFQNGIVRKLDRHVELKLNTGGPPGSTAKKLWIISAEATDAETGLPIPPEEIEIGSLGNLDADGNLYVILPDGDPPVTPRTLWKKHYTFTVKGTSYNPIIMANELTLSDKYVWPDRDFCVGEGVYFNVVGLPDRIYEAKAEWSLPGTYVNRQPDPNCLAFYDTDTNLLTRNSLTDGELTTACWFVKDLPAATVSVTVSYRFSATGKWFTQTLTGKFNVHRPTTTTFSKYQDGIPTMMATNNLLALGMGRDRDMSFGHDIASPGFSGQAGYTQVINGELSIATTGGTSPYLTFTTNWLDNVEFPRGTTTIDAIVGGAPFFYDGPNVGLGTGNLFYNNYNPKFITVNYDTYLLFKPDAGPGPNIFVPLQKVTWVVNATATYGTSWTVTGNPPVTIPQSADCTAFPLWQRVFDNSFWGH